MKYERKCLICDNPVSYAGEADIKLGTITSCEPPICEDCYSSENIEIQERIKEIEKKDKLIDENPILALGF